MEETKKFLESYLRLMNEIKNMEEQREIAWSRATACGLSGGSNSGNAKSDKVGRNVAEYDRCDNIIHELNVEASMVQEEINRYGTLLGEPHRAILRESYLKLKKFEGRYKLKSHREVAKETGYSESSVKRILCESKKFIAEYRLQQKVNT